MTRKLQGPMAPWGLPELLLRRIELHLAGANWQRGGGKSQNRPKPIPLPDDKGRGVNPASSPPADDVAVKLRNLGLVPPGTNDWCHGGDPRD